MNYETFYRYRNDVMTNGIKNNLIFRESQDRDYLHSYPPILPEPSYDHVKLGKAWQDMEFNKFLDTARVNQHNLDIEKHKEEHVADQNLRGGSQFTVSQYLNSAQGQKFRQGIIDTMYKNVKEASPSDTTQFAPKPIQDKNIAELRENIDNLFSKLIDEIQTGNLSQFVFDDVYKLSRLFQLGSYLLDRNDVTKYKGVAEDLVNEMKSEDIARATEESKTASNIFELIDRVLQRIITLLDEEENAIDQNFSTEQRKERLKASVKALGLIKVDKATFAAIGIRPPKPAAVRRLDLGVDRVVHRVAERAPDIPRPPAIPRPPGLDLEAPDVLFDYPSPPPSPPRAPPRDAGVEEAKAELPGILDRVRAKLPIWIPGARELTPPKLRPPPPPAAAPRLLPLAYDRPDLPDLPVTPGEEDRRGFFRVGDADFPVSYHDLENNAELYTKAHLTHLLVSALPGFPSPRKGFKNRETVLKKIHQAIYQDQDEYTPAPAIALAPPSTAAAAPAPAAAAAPAPEGERKEDGGFFDVPHLASAVSTVKCYGWEENGEESDRLFDSDRFVFPDGSEEYVPRDFANFKKYFLDPSGEAVRGWKMDIYKRSGAIIPQRSKTTGAVRLTKDGRPLKNNIPSTDDMNALLTRLFYG